MVAGDCSISHALWLRECAQAITPAKLRDDDGPLTDRSYSLPLFKSQVLHGGNGRSTWQREDSQRLHITTGRGR